MEVGAWITRAVGEGRVTTSVSKHLKDLQGEEKLDSFYAVHRARLGCTL